MTKGNETPTDEQGEPTTERSSQFNRRQLLQVAGAGIASSALIMGHVGAQESPDRFEIVSDRASEVDYKFTSDSEIKRVGGNSFTAAEPDEDGIKEGSDHWTANGHTADGYGDAFSIEGDILSLEPSEGDYRLYLNGKQVTYDEIVQPPEERNHSYSFEANGEEWADYYLEVDDGGAMLPSTLDGATIDPEFHWVSDDGTKAAGRVHPGDRHAYKFDTPVLDSTVEGTANAYVNGSRSDLSWYPRPEATGDGWKGGFPWQEQEEARNHSYSFEANGEEWADYYLEVDDGGAMFASTLDGATIDPEFHWVSDDGTKAAGRVHPGDRHAYKFDTPVLDSTVEGTANAYVNGSRSDLSWYPRPEATGDGWKGGFPWQEEPTEPAETGVVGGGPGYGHTVSQSEADFVVRSQVDLGDALSAAGSGDIVYVAGDASIDLGNRSYDVSNGVTLASDRGVDGASGALLYTDDEPGELLQLHGSARLTGVRVKGPHPGDDWGGSSLAGAAGTLADGEIDNCEIWGFSHHGVKIESGDGAHIHHNVIREINKSGLGYGISVEAGTPVIEYNYFNYNRHSVSTTGENPGYILRHNHFGPTEVMHNIDAHEPAGDRYEIHNNVVETVRREWDNNLNHSVDVRGIPDDVATIHDNWFFNDNAPDPDGSPDTGGQTIVQENVSTWTNVEFRDNYYGEGASVTYSDVIPGYDGWRS